MVDIQGDIVLITGASRGIGRSMALRFSREGALVVATARSREPLETLADEAPTELLAVPADVRDAGDVKRVVEATVDRFGPPDVLVNNAAVGLLSLRSELERLVDVSEDDWDLVIETNLKGPFLFTRETVGRMLENGGGTVINVTSAFGKRGKAGWGPYVSSKHGLEGLTKTTALEYGDDGVTANAVAPGTSVDTGFWNTAEKRRNLTPEQRERVGDPSVMNDAVVLLATQTEGVTGESLRAAEWEERLG